MNRWFGRVFAGVVLSGWFAGVGAIALPQPAHAQTLLRIMSANTTSGNRQSYDPGEGTRIFQGLGPDVVLIQEFNIGDNSEGAIRQWVSSTFGPEFDYYREDDAQIPNGVISRYPIMAAGEWNDVQVGNRDFAWAQIDIPGAVDLWAVSVHFLTRNASVRNSEAAAVRNLVSANIPEGDYLVIGGDLNTRNSGEPALDTLSGLVNTAGPYPVDQAGEMGTNASRRRPYDWVFVDEDLAVLEVPVRVGANTFAHGLVFDSRTYSPISDVSPVLPGDSGATNMQHMAVIRDFEISSDEASDGGDDTPMGATPPDMPDAESLRSCQTVRGAVGEDEWMDYVIEVPANGEQLMVTLAGRDGGDADIYVRQGMLPTLEAYDFRPWSSSSDEVVVVNDRSSPLLMPGRWYVSVNGYSAASYTLSAALEACS